MNYTNKFEKYLTNQAKLAANQTKSVENFLEEGTLGKENPLVEKIGYDLARLSEQYEGEDSFGSTNPALQVHNGRVGIKAIAADGDINALTDELEAHGFKSISQNGAAVVGTLPVHNLDDLPNIYNLQSAMPTYSSETFVGLVTSQGDGVMNADDARNIFGVDGTGITVGVISDSYNALLGANQDIATGDLPPAERIGVLEDLPLAFGSAGIAIDEGRALMQLIHDVAPGADLLFHTFAGVEGEEVIPPSDLTIADAILNLADAGADIIVDDVGAPDETMFQDGFAAQAVDEVVAKGIAYFSSAANGGRTGYESPFNPSGINIEDVGEFHDFDPGPGLDIFQSITVPLGSNPAIEFQWDSPSLSVSPNSGGSPNDLDIYLLDSSGEIVAQSINSNIGGDPIEVLSFENTGEDTNFNLVIAKAEGPDPGLLKYVNRQSIITIEEFNTNSGTLFGHQNAVGTSAVGAAFYQDTPEEGVDPAILESFSSAGPTPILFDTEGNPLESPEIRQKPEIVAPDGTNTTFFFPGIDDDEDGFPNFFGTSAAAPHAAGVAALMKEAAPEASPFEIYEALEETALDMDDPLTPEFDEGFDFASGFGFIQTDAAILELLTPTIAGTDENDTLTGSRGDDYINGDGGNDFFRGTHGDDLLAGRAGEDTFIGNDSADIFSIDPNLGSAPIQGFEYGMDFLSLPEDLTLENLTIAANTEVDFYRSTLIG